jgi:UDP-N-acetylglucosamine 2-epimerase
MHVAVMVGTRPEAIKMAPVVQFLRRAGRHRVSLCATGQHREMLSQALSDFDLAPDCNLDVMRHAQTLAELTARLIEGVDRLLASLHPDWVLVQGDTTTVMVAALCAYHRDIRVGHVEAGLRSFQRRSPFPEEINRRLTGVLADLHFAPTVQARDNLLREGVEGRRVIVTGNSVIDALLWMRDRVAGDESLLPLAVQAARRDERKIVLVTCHRRESFGAAMERIFVGLRTLAARNPQLLLVYPVHLNPSVRQCAATLLAGAPNIRLMEPMAYKPFVAMLAACDLVVSDSGGLQEEAPTFGKPVLVLREVTERPEGVAAGVAKLVGSDPDRIVLEAERLLNDPGAYAAMATAANPYGDGKAAERIAAALDD